MTLPVVFTANGQAGYNLTKSLRFRSSASAYLNRTPSVAATSTTKGTISIWFKGIGQANQYLVGKSSGTIFYLYFNSSNQLVWQNGGVNTFITTQVFRDPSSWYHLVASWDTTQATSSDRQSLYLNGQQITAFGTTNNLGLNATVSWFDNDGNNRGIGTYISGGYFDGYMAEINAIDGQALTPFSFGETSTTTGVWQPKKYTGTYGTNGFYLPFTDTTSTSTLGTDFSGNSNTWTVNNISLTSGSTYDSMTDVPTLTSATTANYAVMNPVYKSASQPTISNGNLTVVSNAGTYQNSFSTIETATTGKYYCEVLFTGNVNSALYCGMSNSAERNYLTTTANLIASTTGGFSIDLQNGDKWTNLTSSTYGSGYTNNDIIQIAYDADNGKLWFGKNGTWQASGNPVAGTNAAFTGITGNYCFGVTAYQHPTLGTSTYNANFGQRPFAYTPPTGFVELNTFNLPTPTIGATASSQANKYMDVTLWTGDGTTNTRSFTNSGSMQPDWIWTKARSATWAHNIFDSVRGFANDKGLNSNLTDAEGTNRNGYVSAANSNGFSMANGTSGNQYYNENGTTYVGWQWRASNTTPVSNTAGSITSTVSANTTAGFSIVTWTGTGANATVGHGLGVAPSMIIIKNRSTVTDWPVYHGSNTTSPATQRVLLNTTDATATSSTYWNNTAPTSSVFSISTYSGVNGNTNAMVAYCFAPIAGYSAFGSYTGNGSSDGTFVYTGFRPRFVLIKRTNAAEGWEMFDSARDTYNPEINLLEANLSNAENSSSTNAVDFLSNGFKMRNTRSATNGTSDTYIYACFAENPFKYANAR